MTHDTREFVSWVYCCLKGKYYFCTIESDVNLCGYVNENPEIHTVIVYDGHYAGTSFCTDDDYGY